MSRDGDVNDGGNLKAVKRRWNEGEVFHPSQLGVCVGIMMNYTSLSQLETPAYEAARFQVLHLNSYTADDKPIILAMSNLCSEVLGRWLG